MGTERADEGNVMGYERESMLVVGNEGMKNMARAHRERCLSQRQFEVFDILGVYTTDQDLTSTKLPRPSFQLSTMHAEPAQPPSA